MISNLQFFKGAVEKKLRKIKEHKLDIAILGRKIEEFCSQNCVEKNHRKYTIEDLSSEIEALEKGLEEDLISSKENKIDTNMGWVSFQTVQDNWIYNVARIIKWLKGLPESISKKYIKVTETLQKADLKKTIINDNAEIFEGKKIVTLGARLYLRSEDVDYPVEGIEIEHQKPKFHYKIKI